MPLDIKQEHIDELIQQEDTKRRFAQKAESSPPTYDTLSPTMMSIIGSLADAGSTYHFLKRGTAQEMNPAYQGMTPAGTAASVAGNGLALTALATLIGKKFPGIANAYLGNKAAKSTGLAGKNFEHFGQRNRFVQPVNSNDSYSEAVTEAVRRDDHSLPARRVLR